MKQATYKSYDELPMFLNADIVSDLLGIAISTTYELMNQKDFPALRINRRLVVEKTKFKEWVDKNSGGSS